MTDETKLMPCPFCGESDQDTLLIEHMVGTVRRPAYRVVCDNCGASTGYSDRGDHVKEWNTRAALAAIQPADPVTKAGCCQSVRVKPLVWTPRPDGRQWYGHAADGLYLSFTAVMSTETGEWSCFLRDFWRPFETIEAAKAAAQADYDARILAALELAPVTLAEALRGPTDNQVASACMSYRHDFGLLPARDREALMFQAREWLRAWQKELPTALRAIREGK